MKTLLLFANPDVSMVRHFLPLWLLFFCWVAINGCQSNRKDQQKILIPLKNDQAVLLIRKTPCYGTCPVYEALLYESGRVLYKGEEHMPAEGQHELWLLPKTIKHLLRQTREVNFYSLAAYYPAQGPDFPSTYLTLYDSDSIKTVRHQEGGPKPLLDLLQYLHEALEEAVKEQVEE
jgi:hypothetical protein